MIVHQVFAQVFKEEVKNIIVCESYPMADYLAKATFGKEAFAVDCLQYPCSIGDKYYDGKFSRVDCKTGEETEILRRPTQEEEIEKLVLEERNILEYQLDIDYRLSCQELKL